MPIFYAMRIGRLTLDDQEANARFMSNFSGRKLYDVLLVPFWIVFSFIIWVFCLRGFLSLQIIPGWDAAPYLEHIRFFVENLARGRFPLWDPLWCHGVPNDFFLRRIGILNPFYSIIVLLEFLGLPFALAGVCFLMVYFWGGMIAFYLLAARLFHHRLIAYAGYLLLMFSSATPRLFFSFEMLITVPI
ncbi:MAG: hypothetical protein HQL22_12895, partial [Candidatus Omnitrophica bacterium]|nr:hypothetical protein [Candidatus Omnitrophota bacterium]